MGKLITGVAALCLFGMQGLWAVSWTIRADGETSYSSERIEATQNGGESDTYSIVVPANMKATVRLRINTIRSDCIGSRRVYVRWNGGSEEILSDEGDGDSHTFMSDGTVTVGVRCSAGTYRDIVGYIKTGTGAGTYLTPQYADLPYKAYWCAVTYDIEAEYESLLPDLTVANLSLSAAEAPVDEAVTLSFSVRNGGGKATGGVSVARVFVDGQQMGGDLSVSALAAGASETKTLTLPRQVAGEHTIRVVADATGRIEESDESNNEATATLLVYERVPYTVRYDPNGGNGTMGDQSFVAGTAQALRRNAFTRTDYTFKGWATEAAGEVVYEDASSQRAMTYQRNDLVTLYAVWEGVPYTVTFDTNGGTVATKTMTFSSAAPCGSLPTAYLDRDDTTSPVFVGWFTDPAGGVQVTADSLIKGDCTLYAHYARPALTVRFDANGGEGTTADVTAYRGCPTSLPRNAFTRTGYYFKGWGLTEGTDVVSYNEGELWTGVQDATLYAVWAEDTRHTHRFDANGGEGTMPDMVVTNEASFTVPDCAFTREGAVFWGWETNTAESVTTYSATWKPVVELDTTARGGMMFATDGDVPWYAAEDDGQEMLMCAITNAVVYVTNRYGQKTYYVASRDARLYVRFPEEEGRYFYRFKWLYPEVAYSWKLRFVHFIGKSSLKDWGYGYTAQTSVSRGWNGWVNVSARDIGTKSKSQSVFCLQSLYVEYNTLKPDEVTLCLDPGVFVRTSYGLSGAATSTNIVVAPESGWEATADADWLSLAPSGDDPRHGVLTLAANNTMEARVGRVAIAWQGESYDITITQAPGIASTVVTFDAQGGEMATNSVRHATGRAFGTLPAPTRQGYAFGGWYTARRGGAKVEGGTIVGEGTKALFARWSVRAYTVTFDANGGSGGTTRTVNYGAALGALPTATRAGFVFGGWTTRRNGGATVAADAAVAGDATLYAYWRLPASTAQQGTPTTGGGGTTGGGDNGGSTTGGGSSGNGGGGISGGDSGTGGTTGGGDGGVVDVLAQALGAGGLVFETGGDAPWVVAPGKSHNGGACVRSGAVGEGGVSWLRTTVRGPGTVSFRWRASCGDVDGLYFSGAADFGVESVAYDSGWVACTRRVAGAGAHTLQWQFSRDSIWYRGIDTRAKGDGCGYLADVVWTPDGGGTAGGGGVLTGDIAGTVDATFAKAQTVQGALYDADGKLAGAVTLKVGKKSKKGTVKISGSALLLNGKKAAAKAVQLTPGADGSGEVALTFKAPVGAMTLKLAKDGTFTCDGSGYTMVKAEVGGPWTASGAKVCVALADGALPGGTRDELLPTAANGGEPITPKGGKWAFAKAAQVKWAKDRATGAFGLTVNTAGGRTNTSALKLTYAPKTGLFKGSFKVYAVVDNRLKKYTAKVTGLVVDGKGQGTATMTKPVAATWTVEVE